MNDLYSIIKKEYPEIEDKEFVQGCVRLQDDGDGIQYIAKWEYSKPIPEGLTLGKPTGGN
jgi:hypothetical protein